MKRGARHAQSDDEILKKYLQDTAGEDNLWVVICNALINQDEIFLTPFRLTKWKSQCQQQSWIRKNPMEKLLNPEKIALAVCKPVWEMHNKRPNSFTDSWSSFCNQFPALKKYM
uniref:Uncharacterized protein n=1 Tax=Romanomermis culicivorax TaxID=13658 RepID=A0A915LBS3_ROMCU